MKLTHDIVERFYQDIDASPVTKKEYRGELLRLLAFLNGRELNSRAVQDYLHSLKERGLTDRTVSRVGFAIKRFFKIQGLPVHFEFPGFDIGPPSGTLREEDVAKLVAKAHNPLERAMVALVYDSACRIVEAMGIDSQEDIEWERGVIRIRRKGRRQRQEEQALFPETLRLLQEYRDWAKIRKGPLFPYSYSSLRRYLLALAARAGVTFPERSIWHSLRHSRAVNLREKGVALEDISDQLGHSSLSTTLKVYSRLSPEVLRSKLTPPPW